MTPTRDTGWTYAPLAPNVIDPFKVRTLPDLGEFIWRIDRENLTVRLRDEPPGLASFMLDLNPLIGCFGVAPALNQAISTATSAENGGNMDYNGFGVGTTVWLPVAVEGALFALGDCHAAQGDGEIAGTGIETTFEVELRLTVDKLFKVNWPRGETVAEIFTVGNARPTDYALQLATTEMLTLLTTDYRLSAVAASHVLGQLARYEVANVFNPAYTMVCRIPKSHLQRLDKKTNLSRCNAQAAPSTGMCGSSEI